MDQSESERGVYYVRAAARRPNYVRAREKKKKQSRGGSVAHPPLDYMHACDNSPHVRPPARVTHDGARALPGSLRPG
jgi:hypothetical protein